MNGGTCSGSRIQCVHARVATCACFPVPSYRLSRVNGGSGGSTLFTAGYLGGECLRPAPLPTGPSSFSLHLHRRLYRAPPGESADLFKRRREAAGLRHRRQESPRFSPLSLCFSLQFLFSTLFYFRFSSLNDTYMCQFTFLVIHTGDFLYLVRQTLPRSNSN